jgi:hypothetical protein
MKVTVFWSATDGTNQNHVFEAPLISFQMWEGGMVQVRLYDDSRKIIGTASYSRVTWILEGAAHAAQDGTTA